MDFISQFLTDWLGIIFVGGIFAVALIVYMATGLVNVNALSGWLVKNKEKMATLAALNC